MLEPLSRCRARWLGEAPGDVPAAFLCRGLHADNHDGFASLAHALHHVGRAWGLAIPERDEHVAGLRHLVIAAHTGGLSEALPISAKELMLDLMFPRPAVAELIRAAGAAGDDLGNAGALRCQRLAQELIVVKATIAFNDDLHGASLLARSATNRKKPCSAEVFFLRAVCCSDTQGRLGFPWPPKRGWAK